MCLLLLSYWNSKNIVSVQFAQSCHQKKLKNNPGNCHFRNENKQNYKIFEIIGWVHSWLGKVSIFIFFLLWNSHLSLCLNLQINMDDSPQKRQSESFLLKSVDRHITAVNRSLNLISVNLVLTENRFGCYPYLIPIK